MNCALDCWLYNGCKGTLFYGLVQTALSACLQINFTYISRMIQPLFNWRTGLAIVAIAIVSGTIVYSQFLARKIAREERAKVEQWVEAGKLLMQDTTGLSDQLAGMIITENTTIPIIETDENDKITQYVNLDSASIAEDSTWLQQKKKSSGAITILSSGQIRATVPGSIIIIMDILLCSTRSVTIHWCSC